MGLDHPTHKSVRCPECHHPFLRAIVWFMGRELMADRGCLCDNCEAVRAAGVAAVSKKAKHLTLWADRVPDDYHAAREDKTPALFLPAIHWRPSADSRRLGLYGKPGSGKSMAASLTVKNAEIPFRWTNGFAAREVYNRSVSSENPEKRKEAVKQWDQWLNAPLLVLDDVDKGNFTEAWASALFSLMEHRNSMRLPTIWTANHGPGQLAAKFAKCGDVELAAAIERRLCSKVDLFQITTS